MKEAYWFKQDSNAKDDPKIIILIEELGLEGYGIFWLLIETLRDQPDFKAPIRIVPALARRFNTSAEKINAVINRYNLFVVEDQQIFYSEALIDRMMPMIQKRKARQVAGRKGALKRWGKHNDSNANGNAIGNANGKQIEDKSRVDKRREEKAPPTLDQCIKYFESKGYNKALANKFFDYYNEPMVDRNGRVWKDGKGKTIKSWKQKAMAVWMKDEDKTTTSNAIGGTI